MSTRSTSVLNTITTPDPSVYPPARASSNVSWMSRSSGVTNPPAAPPSRIASQLARDAAGQVQHLAQRHAEVGLVEAGAGDVAAQAEQTRARGALGADLRVRRAADPQDLQHVDQRLHVVDAGRLAEQPALHRERRLVPRLAALALERVEQRRLLAADVGAGAAPQLDVERRTPRPSRRRRGTRGGGTRRWRARAAAVASGYSPRM